MVDVLLLPPPLQPPLADVGGDGPPPLLLRLFPVPATDPPKTRRKRTNSWTSLLDLLLLRALFGALLNAGVGLMCGSSQLRCFVRSG